MRTALAVAMITMAAVVVEHPPSMRNAGTRRVTDDASGHEADGTADKGAGRSTHGCIAHTLPCACRARGERNTRSDNRDCQQRFHRLPPSNENVPAYISRMPDMLFHR